MAHSIACTRCVETECFSCMSLFGDSATAVDTSDANWQAAHEHLHFQHGTLAFLGKGLKTERKQLKITRSELAEVKMALAAAGSVPPSSGATDVELASLREQLGKVIGELDALKAVPTTTGVSGVDDAELGNLREQVKKMNEELEATKTVTSGVASSAGGVSGAGGTNPYVLESTRKALGTAQQERDTLKNKCRAMQNDLERLQSEKRTMEVQRDAFSESGRKLKIALDEKTEGLSQLAAKAERDSQRDKDRIASLEDEVESAWEWFGSIYDSVGNLTGVVNQFRKKVGSGPVQGQKRKALIDLSVDSSASEDDGSDTESQEETDSGTPRSGAGKAPPKKKVARTPGPLPTVSKKYKTRFTPAGVVKYPGPLFLFQEANTLPGWRETMVPGYTPDGAIRVGSPDPERVP